jgi:hypothetical protein
MNTFYVSTISDFRIILYITRNCVHKHLYNAQYLLPYLSGTGTSPMSPTMWVPLPNSTFGGRLFIPGTCRFVILPEYHESGRCDLSPTVIRLIWFGKPEIMRCLRVRLNLLSSGLLSMSNNSSVVKGVRWVCVNRERVWSCSLCLSMLMWDWIDWFGWYNLMSEMLSRAFCGEIGRVVTIGRCVFSSIPTETILPSLRCSCSSNASHLCPVRWVQDRSL